MLQVQIQLHDRQQQTTRAMSSFACTSRRAAIAEVCALATTIAFMHVCVYISIQLHIHIHLFTRIH